MGIKFTGTTPDDLAAVLLRDSETTNAVALRHQRAVTEHVMEESVLNSPVDTHALEEAHSIVEERSGINTRFISRVEVGGVIGTLEGSKDVSDYAADVHENYDDPAAYTPGPATLAKRAANPGRHVGSKFLERALNESEPMMDAVLDAVMDNLEGWL